MRTAVVGRVGAHRHEAAGAERDLPAIAHQDVEPDGRERQDEERHEDRAQQVLRGDQRNHGEREGQHGDHEEPVLQDREELLVGLVGGLVLAGFAVEHG